MTPIGRILAVVGLLAVAASAGCRSLPSGECQIRCGFSDQSCPDTYACLADGFCHASPTASLCQPDAGGGDDTPDGSTPDGPPIVGCTITGCPVEWDCVDDVCIGGPLDGFVLDVKSFVVSGAVTQNGAQPTSACTSADRATVRFDDDARGYHFSFAVPCNGATTPFTFGGGIFPGTYRVTVTGGLSSLPQERFIARSSLVIEGDTSNVVLDVASFAVSGSVTQNGAQPTSACTSADRATVQFDDDAKNYHFSFAVPCNGATTPFTFGGGIFPGTYRVTVRGGLSSLPQERFVARSALVIAGNTSNLVLDVASFAMSGAVTQNGAQPTSACTSADRATVRFDDDAKGYHFSFAVPCNGATTPFTFGGGIFAGTYRVTVRGGLSSLPQEGFVARSALVVSGNTSNLVLDVASFAMSGAVTQNGAQPTSACTSADRATVRFDDDANNYHFSFAVPCNGATTPFTFGGGIFPGTYRVTVRGGLSSLPQEGFVARPALVIAGDTSNLVLDVASFAVSGVVTQNGAQPTSGCTSADRATVFFDDPAHAYHFQFAVACNGATTPFTFAGGIFPGSYRVTVRGGLSSLPQERFVARSALAITSNTPDLALDVSSLAISGRVTQNGVQPTSGCTSADRATVLFEDFGNNYHFQFAVPCNGATTPFTFGGAIFPGIYQISVQGGLSSLPQQPFMIAGQLKLP